MRSPYTFDKERIDRLEEKVFQLEYGNPPPEGLNGLVIFFLVFSAVGLSALTTLLSTHGKEIMADFLAYILPIVAAIIAGLVIYYPALGKKYFLWSGGFLVSGLVAYTVSKGYNLSIIIIIPYLGEFLIFGILYDELLNYQYRSAFEKLGMVLLAFSFVIIALFLNVLTRGAMREKVEIGCHMSFAKHTRVTIAQKTVNILNGRATPLGAGALVEFSDGAVMTFDPCPQHN